MSDLTNAVVLIIMLIGTAGFIRAIYGVFAWKGRRKAAFVQAAAIPIGTLLVMSVILVSTSDENVADNTPTSTDAEAVEISQITMATTDDPPETEQIMQLGQWCYQERMNEMFDRIITISDHQDGTFMATTAYRTSESEQELNQREDGSFAIVDSGGEFYALSDDLEQIEIHDRDGLIGTGFAHTYNSTCYRPEGTAQEELQAEQEANACRNDVVCWADKHSVAASVRCVPPIERSANFTMEWTDRWLERKFSHMRWQDRESGIISFIGDRARFQNGFGAWQNVIYECDYDTENDAVLDISVRPGRLN